MKPLSLSKFIKFILYDIYFAIQKNFVRDGTKLWDTMQEDDKAIQKNL